MGTALAFDIHDRLLKARRHAGLTQSELASRLGVGRRSITRYEDGQGTPNRATLLGWSLVTGVDPHWLEHGEEDAGTRSDPPRTQQTTQSRCNPYPPEDHDPWDMPEAA